MMAQKKILLSLLSLLYSLHILAGGGWVYQKNKGFLKLGQNMIRSQYFFDSGGNITDIPTVSLYTTSFYGEYGLSDRLNVVLYVPFFVRSTLNRVEFNQSGNTIPGDEINSFGDTNVGLKYGMFQDQPVHLAASLIFGLPFGSSEVSSDRILQTGDGEFNQLLKLEASHSISGTPAYITGILGFNNRTQGFSDEFHYGGEIGVSLKPVTALLKVYSVNSLYNGDADTSNANGVFANNTEYVSFTPELIYALENGWGFAASAGFASSGKRILAAPNFGIGVFLQL
ncbi:MAG: hypothetical protein RIC30_12115 [Marinoscillum sp.]|uniref:hypothetical protein n=2 Tax=Marinoscillum sp. TaxID=2024838 RepID=UPI0032FE4AAE